MDSRQDGPPSVDDFPMAGGVMRIHFIWMAFISLLAIMLAIGAAVYDANYRTKYMPTEKSFQVQMIQGNKARLCALVSSGPRKKYGYRRWDKNDYASCTDWLELKTRVK